MSELIEKLINVRNNGSKRQAHIDLANECIQEVISLALQLADEKEKTKALLVGLEVQKVDDFIAQASIENYKQLGENITTGFKTQLKEKDDE